MVLSPKRNGTGGNEIDLQAWATSGVRGAPLPRKFQKGQRGTMSPAREERTLSPHRFTPAVTASPMSPYYSTVLRTPVERGVKGASKVLLIGISYRDDAAMSLPSAVHETRSMQQYLTRAGFTPRERRVLTEDHPDSIPTRTNILSSLRWLVRGAVSGDALFLHFAGHGVSSVHYEDQHHTGLEEGEAIAPVDYKSAGLIYSEELFDILAGGLPAGVRLTCIFDCVKPGACPLDLPYKLLASDAGFTLTESPQHPIPAQIVLLSHGSEGRVNALTTSFIAACNANPNLSYRHLITDMLAVMKQQHGANAPIPRLSSSRAFEMNEPFVLAAVPEESTPAPSTPPTRKEQELARRLEQLEKQLSEKPARRSQQRHTPVKPVPVPRDTSAVDDEVLGASKALLVGVSYGAELACSTDNVRKMQSLLMDLGFNARMQALTDDTQAAHLFPTRANIITSLKWLAKDATPGDVLFLYFSGYGSVIPGYEVALADALAPTDFETKGFITGDELHSVLLRDLPEGVKVLIVADCAKGGTLVKPPYKISMHGDSMVYQHEAYDSTDDSSADVLVFSTPPEVPGEGGEDPAHPGVLTSSFINVLEANPQQKLLPLLKSIKVQMDNSVAGLSPVVQSSKRLDERSLFYLGSAPQNLKPRKRPDPEHAKIAPTRSAAEDQMRGTGAGIAGIYKVESTSAPAAVAVDGTAAILFSTEMGERKGVVTEKGVALDEGDPTEPGIVAYDAKDGKLRFPDGTVWVKQGGGAGPAEPPSLASDPGMADTHDVPAKKAQQHILGAAKTLLISCRYRGTDLEVVSPAYDKTMLRFLQRQGFGAETRVLADESTQSMPTRSNIMSSLRWLVSNPVPGDALYLVVSARMCFDGLAPCDYHHTGGIDTETLRRTLVSQLPAGVKLTVLWDIEERGEVVDLPYHLVAMGNGGFSSKERPGLGEAEVLMFYLTGGGTGGCGALGTAYMTVMNQVGGEGAAEMLLTKMRDVARQRLGDDSCGVGLATTQKVHPADVYGMGARQRPLVTGVHTTLADSTRGEGTARAVLISVSYNNKLPNADAALHDIKNLLLRQGYPSGCIRVLSDTAPGTPQPTKGNILASLRWLINSCDPGDNLFLYFVGYGGEPPTDEGKGIPPKQLQGIAPVDWMTHGVVTPQEITRDLIAPAPHGVNIMGLFDTVYCTSPVDLPYMLTCERDGGTSYAHLPSSEHPGNTFFITTTPDVRAPKVSALSGVLTSVFVRTLAGYGHPPSCTQLMYGVNSMLGGMVRDSGHLPRLISSRKFSETDVFAINAKKPETRAASPASPVTPLQQRIPYHSYRQSPVSRDELDYNMRQIQQGINDALSMAKSRTGQVQSAHRSPPRSTFRSPSPPGFLQSRTLLLNSLDEPFGMRLNPCPEGMVVASVADSSPAARSGIAPGEIITTIINYPVCLWGREGKT